MFKVFTLTLTKFNDPGHGWLRVPKKIYKRIGPIASPWSYVSKSGSFYYLEEDCDAPKALKYMRDILMIDVTIVNKYTNKQSHIRSMDSVDHHWHHEPLSHTQSKDVANV